MHPIVEQIYATKTVSDGTTTYSALNEQGQPTYMDRAEGELLQRVIADVQPTSTLEVGMAYGVSTVFICEALAKLPSSAAHIAIDPYQHEKWRGIGMHNVAAAGFGTLVTLLEERSELCLPRLLQERREIQMALIDGLHVFEQCALEFYYIDRLLPVGGVVVFDDVDWPPIRRVVRMVLGYGTYRVKAHTGGDTRGTWKGTLRQLLRRVPGADGIFAQDLLVRDWELGFGGTCVALEKIRSGRRTHGEYKPF